MPRSQSTSAFAHDTPLIYDCVECRPVKQRVTHWSRHDDTLPEKGGPATGVPFTPRLPLRVNILPLPHDRAAARRRKRTWDPPAGRAGPCLAGCVIPSEEAAAFSAGGAPSGERGGCAKCCGKGAGKPLAGAKQHQRHACHQREGEYPFARKPRRVARETVAFHANSSPALAAWASAASPATLDTISSREAPGWNTCRTPAFRNLRSSSSGTMPPTTTGT